MYLFGSMAYFVLSLWVSVVLSELVFDLVANFQFYVFGHQGALYQYFYGSFPSLTLFVPDLMCFYAKCWSVNSISDFLILATRGHCLSTFIIVFLSWFLLCWICNRLGCLHHPASLKHLNLPHFSFGHQVALFMYLSDDIAYFVLSLWISNVFSILSTVLVAHFQFYVIGHQGALH